MVLSTLVLVYSKRSLSVTYSGFGEDSSQDHNREMSDFQLECVDTAKCPVQVWLDALVFLALGAIPFDQLPALLSLLTFVLIADKNGIIMTIEFIPATRSWVLLTWDYWSSFARRRPVDAVQPLSRSRIIPETRDGFRPLYR